MRLDHFSALTFDCYGTLVDWEAGILAALRPWATAGRVTVDDEGCWRLHASWRRRPRSGRSPLPRCWASVLRGLGERFGAAPTGRRGGVRRVGKDWPAFPDTPEALAA